MLCCTFIPRILLLYGAQVFALTYVRTQSRLIRQGFQGQQADLKIITESISTLTTSRPFERRVANATESLQGVASPNADATLVEMKPNTLPRHSLWTKKTVAFNGGSKRNVLGTIESNWQQNIAWPAAMNDQAFAQQESKYLYTFVPATWLRNMGLSWSIRLRILISPDTGWQYTLHAPRLIACKSLIFAACEQGNINVIQTLIAEGRASVRDEDYRGFTPLWVRYNHLIGIL